MHTDMFLNHNSEWYFKRRRRNWSRRGERGYNAERSWPCQRGTWHSLRLLHLIACIFQTVYMYSKIIPFKNKQAHWTYHC